VRERGAGNADGAKRMSKDRGSGRAGHEPERLPDITGLLRSSTAFLPALVAWLLLAARRVDDVAAAPTALGGGADGLTHVRRDGTWLRPILADEVGHVAGVFVTGTSRATSGGSGCVA